MNFKKAKLLAIILIVIASFTLPSAILAADNNNNNNNNANDNNETADATVDIPVEITWEGTEKDAVNLKLFNDIDEDPVAEKELTAADNWKYTFKDVPKYNESDEAYVFELVHTKFDGYTIEDKSSPYEFNIKYIEDDYNEPDVNIYGIDLDKQHTIGPNEKLLINHNSHHSLLTPSDLPAGTKLTVTSETNSNEAQNAGGLEVAGEVFDFDFDFPNDNFTGDFELELLVDEEFNPEDADIYHYDNKDGWEAQNADKFNRILVLKPSHFSMYGVFAAVNDDNGTIDDGTSCADEMTINFDEETDICSDQIIHIADTGSVLTTPKDLPANSTLTISSLEGDDIPSSRDSVQVDGEKLKLAFTGYIYDFDLDTNGEDYQDLFTLAMDFSKHFHTEQGIYYYNPQSDVWERQVEDRDLDTEVVTTELPHLSIYGLLGVDIDQGAEELCDDEITINYDEETPICGDQKVNISDSNDFIHTPADLPEGSTIEVSNVSEDYNEVGDSLLRCGNVFDITVTTPEGMTYDDSFTLTMLFCNGFQADDIYLFNADTDQWEKQNGEFDYDDFSITVHPDHFSKYGVFALNETEEGTGTNQTEGNDTTDDETTVTVIGGTDDAADNADGEALPKTATNVFNLILIGIFLLLIGSIAAFYFKKRTAK